jgi:hypothetical protein
MLGNRLRRIGPHEVTYDMLGNRVRTIGPLVIKYDRLGNRPRRVQVPHGSVSLSDDLLLALFIVLYLEEEAE